MTMGIMRYGFTSFLRNRGRSTGITVVVIIAVAMFSGISIASASLTSYQVQKSLSSEVFDLRVASAVDNPSSMLTTLLTVKHDYPAIDNIIPITFQDYPYYQLVLNGSGAISWGAINASNYNQSYFVPRATLVGVNAADMNIPRLQGIINVTKGSFPENNNSIMLDENAANHYKLSIGMNLSVGLLTTNIIFVGNKAITENYTRDVSGLVISGIFRVHDYQRLAMMLAVVYEDNQGNIWRRRSAAAFDLDQVMIWANFPTMHDTLAKLTPKINTQQNNGFAGYISSQVSNYFYGIVIDHLSINVLDISGSQKVLLQISNAIYSRGGVASNFVIYDDLYQDISYDQTYMEGMQAILLLLAIPPLFIGIYLAMTISDQSLERRISEIGQLKSKGANNRQIASWFVVENTIVGSIGGALGYVAGFGTCFAFLAAELQGEFSTFLGMNLVHGDWFSFVLSIAIGVGICVIVVIDPVRRLNKIPVVDVTKKQMDFPVYKAWKSRFDVSALVTGAIPIIWLVVLSNINVQSLPYMLQSPFLIASMVMTGMSVLASFFLTYGLIKIIAGRSPKGFSRIAQGVARIIAPKTSWLIGRNVGGRPKQSGGLVFIIALTVSMVIVLPIIKASENTFESDLSQAIIGSDIQVSLPYNSNLNEITALARNLSTFSPDIAKTTSLLMYYSARAHGNPQSGTNQDQSTTLNTYIYVCGLNASEYPSVVHFDSGYISSGNPDDVFSQLASTPNGTLLLQSWADANGYRVGDPFIISFPSNYNVTRVAFTIVGFFSILPGMVIFGGNGISEAAVNINYLVANNITSEEYLSRTWSCVLVRTIADPSLVIDDLANAIEAQYLNNFTGAYTIAKEVSYFQNFLYGGLFSITSLFDIEFAFIIVIATTGIGIVIYRSGSDRRREIATLRARGTEFKQLFKMLAGEGTTLILLGLILGCLGILIAFTINVQISKAFYEFITFPRPFVVPPIILLQLGLTFAILLAVVLLVSWREVKRTDIPGISDALRVH